MKSDLTDAFFFQAEDGIRDLTVTGVQTCALPIWRWNCVDSEIGVIDRLEQWRAPTLDNPTLDTLMSDNFEQTATQAAAFQKIWMRSEERRVGEECRSRWSPDH